MWGSDFGRGRRAVVKFGNYLIAAGLVTAFALAGVMFITSPAFNVVITLDGVPLERDYLWSEEVEAVISGKRTSGFYVTFLGLRIPGVPLYWMLAIIAA